MYCTVGLKVSVPNVIVQQRLGIGRGRTLEARDRREEGKTAEARDRRGKGS